MRIVCPFLSRESLKDSVLFIVGAWKLIIKNNETMLLIITTRRPKRTSETVCISGISKSMKGNKKKKNTVCNALISCLVRHYFVVFDIVKTIENFQLGGVKRLGATT